MEIVTLEMERELADRIDRYAGESVDGDDLADLIASDPRLACGMSPQRFDDVADVVAVVGELFDRFVEPEVDDAEPLREEVLSYVRGELEEKVSRRVRRREATAGPRDPLHDALGRPVEPSEYPVLLTHDDPQVRFHASQGIAEHVDEQPELARATDALVANLDDESRMVKLGAARALAEVSRVVPEAVGEATDVLRTEVRTNDDPLVKLEVLSALDHVLAADAPCESSPTEVVNTLSASLTTEEFDEIREAAAAGLAVVAERAPTAAENVYPVLWKAWNVDPYPPVEAHAEEAIETLEDAPAVDPPDEPDVEDLWYSAAAGGRFPPGGVTRSLGSRATGSTSTWGSLRTVGNGRLRGHRREVSGVDAPVGENRADGSNDLESSGPTQHLETGDGGSSPNASAVNDNSLN